MKYHNKKTVIDGITFDSKAEAARYMELKLLSKAHIISDLVLQPTFELIPGYTYYGKKIRPMRYRADFAYLENGKRVVEDVKGMKTKDYLIKKKIFLYQNPLLDFREV